jgi:hypothetical protein
MEYSDFLAELKTSHQALAERIGSFTSLEHVLNWLKAEDYPLRQLDMITQDEFCHDLLVPAPKSSEFLVFGMT